MFFRQVQQHGDNFSYLIADKKSGEAAIVDSSFNSGRLIELLRENNFILKYVINTHGHTDHIAGNAELSSKANVKIVAYKHSRVRFDIGVDDGDILRVGKIPIKVIYTPGHTKDGICLLIGKKKLLSGDTLFVGECGRTDLPGGSSLELFDSLFNKILKLYDNIEVYPGHDYGNRRYSTIGNERNTNYTLKPRTIEEFIEFMNEP